MAAKKGFNFLYPLVICIVIIIGLAAMSINMNSTIEDERAATRSEISKRQSQEKKNEELQKEVWQLREFITGSDDQVVATETLRATLFDDFSNLKVQLQVEQGNEAAAQNRKEYTYLEEFYGDVKEDLRWQSQTIASLRTEVETLRKDLDNERVDKEKVRADKEAQIVELDTKLTEEQNARQDDNRKNTERIQVLIDEKGEIAEAQEEMRKDFQVQIAERDSRIAELGDRIKNLVKKQELTLATAEPDGEVIFVENEQLTAYIDLGRVHGLAPGLPFDVFQIEKGGRRKHKGRVEVRDLKDDWATVTITQTADVRDPIVKGDRIISPLFSKGETQIYVLLGEMVNPRYSRAEIVRKIEEAGGKVEPAVTVETDFIVAGKDHELLPEFDKALQLGIVVLREEQLLDFISP